MGRAAKADTSRVVIPAWDCRSVVGAAFRVPERPDIVRWCEENVVIPHKGNVQGGPWRAAAAPYQVEPLRACADRDVREITLMTSTQVGKTLVGFLAELYWIDQDPGNILHVLPTEEIGRDTVQDRIIPFVRSTRPVRSALVDETRALGVGRIEFDRCILYLGWSNAPGSLASRPCPYAVCDEVDKFPRHSGKEAPPINLARERLKNFAYSRLIKSSTPTTQDGAIYHEWQRSDQCFYWVPCPHCGVYQTLTFAQVRFPADDHDPLRIEKERLAWYECNACRERISENRKGEMLAGGVWAPVTARVDKDGRVWGYTPSTHRGFHLNALYSTFTSWSSMVREFLESKDNPGMLMNFKNSWEGWPWEERVTSVTSDEIDGCRAEYRLVDKCPNETVGVTFGADVQDDRVYCSARAWLAEGESRLIRTWEIRDEVDHVTGEIVRKDLDLLAEATTGQVWRRENGSVIDAVRGCIDSGHRTAEVYEMCRKHRQWRAVKGSSHDMPSPVRATVIDKLPSGKPLRGGVQLWIVDTNYYKDILANMWEEGGKWFLPADVDDGYLKQLGSEHKIRVRDSRGLPKGYKWVAKSEHADNHYLDCEVYNLVAASLWRLDRVPESRVEQMKAEHQEREKVHWTQEVQEDSGQSPVQQRRSALRQAMRDKRRRR